MMRTKLGVTSAMSCKRPVGLARLASAFDPGNPRFVPDLDLGNPRPAATPVLASSLKLGSPRPNSCRGSGPFSAAGHLALNAVSGKNSVYTFSRNTFLCQDLHKFPQLLARWGNSPVVGAKVSNTPVKWGNSPVGRCGSCSWQARAKWGNSPVARCRSCSWPPRQVKWGNSPVAGRQEACRVEIGQAQGQVGKFPSCRLGGRGTGILPVFRPFPAIGHGRDARGTHGRDAHATVDAGETPVGFMGETPMLRYSASVLIMDVCAAAQKDG